MSLSFGEEKDTYIDNLFHIKKKSRKKMKRDRNHKLRKLPLEADVRSYTKKYDGYEW